MTGYTIDELVIGQRATTSKTISEYDVYGFAGITGDFNPAHVDEVYAQSSPFKKRIAHGFLSVGFISALLGTQLPGPGTIYLGQDVKFSKPVYFGDTITTTVTIEKLVPEKNIVTLQTVCTNQQDQVVVTGTATVLAPTSSK